MRETAGLTQAEAAAGLGVDKGSISRWENGTRRISAEDFARAHAFYAEAADKRAKAATKLGQSVPRGTPRAVREHAASYANREDSWSPNPALVTKIPKRAYEVAIAYCTRLQNGGWPREEIEQIERLMIDPRYAQANKRKGVELSEDEYIMLIDATWEAVKHSAAALGRQV